MRTRIQYARLEKLAKHLRSNKLGHKKFDFATINDNVPLIPAPGATPGCGTSGCAMGECPVIFSKAWRFEKPEFDGQFALFPLLREDSSGDIDFDVQKFFGINPNVQRHLFYPNSQRTKWFGGKELGYFATAKQVASNILAYLKRAKAKKIPPESTYVY